MITFWSHKEIDLLPNLNNYNKTLLKTERPLTRLQSQEPMNMLNSNHKLLNIMKPSVPSMSHWLYSANWKLHHSFKSKRSKRIWPESNNHSRDTAHSRPSSRLFWKLQSKPTLPIKVLLRMYILIAISDPRCLQQFESSIGWLTQHHHSRWSHCSNWFWSQSYLIKPRAFWIPKSRHCQDCWNRG